ncbi:MAG: nucleotidyltransferase domain-containing protein [Promethearchaeota archaeon]|nr:MAG: nucleotidyltransferase domain-containing protein [Candidatus Lokiarchaeota archaeon]
MQRLKEISERISNRKIKLRKALNSLIIQLKEFGAIKIYIFGSFVRDEIDVNSDLDLLVIMPSNKPGKEWISLIYNNIKRDISTDIIVFSNNEFENQIPSNSFLKNIVNSGRLLYEKT